MGIPDEPSVKDLTPGDFRNGMKPVEVNTDSMHMFGMTFAMQSQSYFGGTARMLARGIRNDTDGYMGSRAIGNSTTLHELVSVADYGRRAGVSAETLAIDLTFGCTAMGNGAAWMAEQYGSSDWNSGVTTSNIHAAFNPPADAKLKYADKRTEMIREATLPRVDPSDVKFYLQSGQRPGIDFIVEGSGAPPPVGNPNDPTGSNNNGSNKNNQGSDKPPNEFWVPEKDEEIHPDKSRYEAPPPPDLDDTDTVAPGKDFGTGEPSSSPAMA